MVTARFLYALGYHVPENYSVRFDRTRLVAHAEGQTVSSAGRPRRLFVDDIDAFLRNVPGSGGRYRAVATRLPESREALLGPYQYWGTRSDDPNDIVPHEHRRDLRGLFVFAAWLNNSGARAVDTHDILTSAVYPGSVTTWWTSPGRWAAARGRGPNWCGRAISRSWPGWIRRAETSWARAS